MLVGCGALAIALLSVLCMLIHCLLLQGYLSTEVSALLRKRTMLICPDVSVDQSLSHSGCFAFC